MTAGHTAAVPSWAAAGHTAVVPSWAAAAAAVVGRYRLAAGQIAAAQGIPEAKRVGTAVAPWAGRTAGAPWAAVGRIAGQGRPEAMKAWEAAQAAGHHRAAASLCLLSFPRSCV